MILQNNFANVQPLLLYYYWKANAEKVIYFFSLESYLTNKLKSHMLFTNFVFSNFT